jgi:hypothetical protein
MTPGGFQFGAGPGGHLSHLITAAEVLLRADSFMSPVEALSVPYTRAWKLLQARILVTCATHLCQGKNDLTTSVAAPLVQSFSV